MIFNFVIKTGVICLKVMNTTNDLFYEKSMDISFEIPCFSAVTP